MLRRLLSVLAIALGISYAGVLPASASNPTPYPGTLVTKTSHHYQALIRRLEAAVRANKMGLVTRASATLGGKTALKMTIPGNMVIGVYHPRFAIRMLKASVAAGIEAPLRFYLTENADRTGTLTYRKPSSIFALYQSGYLDKMALELDKLFCPDRQSGNNSVRTVLANALIRDPGKWAPKIA